jgi:hypothetical protein
LSPRCADLFADRDLLQHCAVTRISGNSYPHAFVDFLGEQPAAPWIYTGGLENWPAIIQKMSSLRQLWGNARPALDAARSPWDIASLMHAAGLSCPEVRPWLYAKPFRYCGSIGPLQVDESQRGACQRLGNVIAQGCELRGIFGVDCVTRDGHLWPVEVNPRYTASVEVLELALGISLIARHARIFTPLIKCIPDSIPCPSRRIVGKAILFARESVDFPANGPWLDSLKVNPGSFQVPLFADIPHPGERIAAGRPVLTLFSEDASVEDCVRSLKQKVAELEKTLHRTAQ